MSLQKARSGSSQVPVLAWCLLGTLVSLYAYHVGHSNETVPDYTALCDINEHISCSKVVSSRYGKGFGVIGLVFGEDSILNQPNCLIGLVFYFLQVLLEIKSTYAAAKVQTIASIVANLGSIYLAALLYWAVESFCLICIAIYVINAALLFCNWKKLATFTARQRENRQRKQK